MTTADLEHRRAVLLEYARCKLDEEDFHAVADAATDLRVLDVELRLRGEDAYEEA